MFHTKDILWVTLVFMYDCMFRLYKELHKFVRTYGNLQTCDDRIFLVNLQYFIVPCCEDEGRVGAPIFFGKLYI